MSEQSPIGASRLRRATSSKWVLVASGVALGASAWAALDPARGRVAVLLAAGAVVLAGFAWLEAGPSSTRDLALVATLAGIAAAGRVLFAPIPGVQPVTVVVVASGAALGPRRGFAVGALAALASNVFLGQGPYTPWQMIAWGGCGVVAGLLRPVLRRRSAFAALCLVLGYAYGMVLDLWQWYAFMPHTWAGLTVTLGAGFAFNTAHAVGNLVLALVAGPELRRVLERHERRARTEVVWA